MIAISYRGMTDRTTAELSIEFAKRFSLAYLMPYRLESDTSISIVPAPGSEWIQLRWQTPQERAEESEYADWAVPRWMLSPLKPDALVLVGFTKTGCSSYPLIAHFRVSSFLWHLREKFWDSILLSVSEEAFRLGTCDLIMEMKSLVRCLGMDRRAIYAIASALQGKFQASAVKVEMVDDQVFSEVSHKIVWAEEDLLSLQEAGFEVDHVRSPDDVPKSYWPSFWGNTRTLKAFEGKYQFFWEKRNKEGMAMVFYYPGEVSFLREVGAYRELPMWAYYPELYEEKEDDHA
jgi:hypothetical protein